nr:9282_t:CDS:2 [Entrophospora candida]
MEEGWAAELEKRKRLPGETIDAFTAHISIELFRRIGHGNNYPDRIKARKAYEMTYSRGGTLSAYSAE